MGVLKRTRPRVQCFVLLTLLVTLAVVTVAAFHLHWTPLPSTRRYLTSTAIVDRSTQEEKSKEIAHLPGSSSERVILPADSREEAESDAVNSSKRATLPAESRQEAESDAVNSSRRVIPPAKSREEAESDAVNSSRRVIPPTKSREEAESDAVNSSRRVIPPAKSRQEAESDAVNSSKRVVLPAESKEKEESRAFNSSGRAPSPVKRKKIVYACWRQGGCGGWADRQKGIVGAYVLAEMLGRDFGVHFPQPCELARVLAPNRVQWVVSLSDVTGPRVQTLSRLDSGAVAFAKKLLSHADLHAQLPHDVTVLTWNMEVVQYLLQHQLAANVSWLAGRTVAEVYRRALGDLFTLQPHLQEQLARFQHSRPPHTRLVCAQMRLGKHKGSFPDVESWHTFDQLPILLDFLAQYNDSARFRVLFTSDSVQMVNETRASLAAVSLTIPGPITHTDKSQGPQACEGFQKAVLDQYALATCDVLVISESGIGKIAAFMRGTDRDLYLFHDVKIDNFTRDGRFPNKKGW